MDALANTAVLNASTADVGSVQGTAAVSVFKRAINLQASAVAKLIESLPPPGPALATSGSLGTQIDTYA